MIYKLGDNGAAVAQIQKWLSLIGYDLVSDGIFGQRTQRSVKAFQKKYGLEQDGVVGQKTMSALKAAQKKSKEEKPTSNEDITTEEVLKIRKDVLLPSEQYIKQNSKKDKIFIHFTAGSYNAERVIRYWDSNVDKIATSYVIAGPGKNSIDGEIFETFDPNFWAFHLGVKNSKGKLDKSSIGIEICSYGPIKLGSDGKYYTYVNSILDASEVIKLEKPHRGYIYYHKFSDKQMENLEKLLKYLVKRFDIKVQDNFNSSWFEYNEELVKNNNPGIWGHVSCRKDKFDPYVDERLLKILNDLKK